jgi:cytochrome c553
LITQNSDYVLQQLEDFANRTRANDINEAMRTIAGLLSDDERHALAEYYGAGLGMNPGSPGTSK